MKALLSRATGGPETCVQLNETGVPPDVAPASETTRPALDVGLLAET